MGGFERPVLSHVERVRGYLAVRFAIESPHFPVLLQAIFFHERFRALFPERDCVRVFSHIFYDTYLRGIVKLKIKAKLLLENLKNGHVWTTMTWVPSVRRVIISISVMVDLLPARFLIQELAHYPNRVSRPGQAQINFPG